MFQLEPATWDVEATFPIECYDVFNSDADETAHPLHIDMRNLNDLAGVFDLTSYVKGNCMARMIYYFLGERIFLSSVRRYMRTYYYRSADQEDLWSAFQAEMDANKGPPASSRLSMKDIMRTWTHQAGLPVLRVRQERETGAIELAQVRPWISSISRSQRSMIPRARRRAIVQALLLSFADSADDPPSGTTNLRKILA